MGLFKVFPNATIFGVDIELQPRYPFCFIHGDALEIKQIGGVLFTGSDFASRESENDDFKAGTHRGFSQRFDFIWASPPCQHYTQMLNHGRTPRSNHADLIGRVRAMLRGFGIPYVIENVAGAPLENAVMLCGTMFSLQTLRHRFFECSFPVVAPEHPKHNGKGIRNQKDGGTYYRCYGHETGKREWGKAMGIDWMKTPELAQAIPPAYSRYIAEQFCLTNSKLYGGETVNSSRIL